MQPEAAISGHARCRESLPAHVSDAAARLNLDESAIDEGRWKKAFRKMALTVHPDQGGDERDFLRLQEDCEIIQRHFGYRG
jgi:hypothetical protein